MFNLRTWEYMLHCYNDETKKEGSEGMADHQIMTNFLL